MKLDVWDTGQPRSAEFDRAWRATLGRCSHANFTFDPAFLEWDARRGRHALAVRAQEGERAGALVLRVQGGTLVSGWPWRWQVIVEDPERGDAMGITTDECAWLFDAATRVAGGRRLRCLLPVVLPGHRAAFRVGATLLRPVDAEGEALLARLDVNKRRAVKRALREGWQVRAAASDEERRAFTVIQRQVDARHGAPLTPLPAGTPPPGEAWREWEMPWLWLLVAVRDGVVGAGSGFGVTPGGTIEYRANASTEEARKAGVNALLAYEALCGARRRGCHWMNWGGVTEFKRELGGERIEIHGHLGGGVAWALPNAAAAAWHHGEARLRALARRLRARRSAP